MKIFQVLLACAFFASLCTVSLSAMKRPCQNTPPAPTFTNVDNFLPESQNLPLQVIKEHREQLTTEAIILPCEKASFVCEKCGNRLTIEQQTLTMPIYPPYTNEYPENTDISPLQVAQEQGAQLTTEAVMLPCKKASFACRKCVNCLTMGCLLGCSAGGCQSLFSPENTIEACEMYLCAPCAQSLICCEEHKDYCPFYQYLQCTKDCFPEFLADHYTRLCHENKNSLCPWFLVPVGCLACCKK